MVRLCEEDDESGLDLQYLHVSIIFTTLWRREIQMSDSLTYYSIYEKIDTTLRDNTMGFRYKVIVLHSRTSEHERLLTKLDIGHTKKWTVYLPEFLQLLRTSKPISELDAIAQW